MSLVDRSCIICKEHVSPEDEVQCIRCHIFIHKDCETRYTQINNRPYSQCHNCRRVGTLGIRKPATYKKLFSCFGYDISYYK